MPTNDTAPTDAVVVDGLTGRVVVVNAGVVDAGDVDAGVVDGGEVDAGVRPAAPVAAVAPAVTLGPGLKVGRAAGRGLEPPHPAAANDTRIVAAHLRRV
ncbi:MAG: hypothetical protein M3083_12470 [Actinomycetota bacterium]|nr:hypothetical protein [Actinomycetota bacterium]